MLPKTLQALLGVRNIILCKHYIVSIKVFILYVDTLSDLLPLQPLVFYQNSILLRCMLLYCPLISPILCSLTSAWYVPFTLTTVAIVT